MYLKDNDVAAVSEAPVDMAFGTEPISTGGVAAHAIDAESAGGLRKLSERLIA